MPMFYFHLHDYFHVRDEDGVEFDSLDAARAQAEREARVVFAHSVAVRGEVVLSHRIDIEDANRRVLATVRFGDAVRIKK